MLKIFPVKSDITYASLVQNIKYRFNIEEYEVLFA